MERTLSEMRCEAGARQCWAKNSKDTHNALLLQCSYHSQNRPFQKHPPFALAATVTVDERWGATLLLYE